MNLETAVGKGKTLDDAINQALTELSMTREEVEVKVIQESEAGMFGIFGKKQAIVEVTPIFKPISEAKRFLEEIFKAMDLEGEIEVEMTAKRVMMINLVGEDMGVLIGRRGQTLDALQYLTGLVVNKASDEYVRVLIDTENYRSKREETLRHLADKMAGKVMRYHKAMRLEPMNPSERRIIHATLQNHDRVYTFSEGDEPYRHVVIELKD